MVSSTILAFLGVVAVAYAQETVATSSAPEVAASTTVSESMPPSATQAFDAAAVNSSIRSTWCQGQLNNCPQLCGGSASRNFCDTTELTYDCVCGNGTVPDVTAYADTLPFFICQETYIQCVADHPDDREGQQLCTENQQCGTRNATAEAVAATGSEEDSSPSETGTSATSSVSESASSTASDAATASESDSAATAISYQMSTGVFAIVLAGAFALFA